MELTSFTDYATIITMMAMSASGKYSLYFFIFVVELKLHV